MTLVHRSSCKLLQIPVIRSLNVTKEHLYRPWACTSVACYKNWKPQPKFHEIDFPFEKRRLRFIERNPNPLPQFGKHLKMPKKLFDMRGPELYHNYLLHEQFGIRAKLGGRMHWGHMDMIRLTVNRKMDETRMFAIWRVDTPWKSITKKGQGHRMGGGKGSIDKFVTPVKAGRIIIEMGGACDFEEIFPILDQVARKLPFPAEVVNQDMILKEKEEEDYLKNNNRNPFTFKHCLENNMMGCKSWAGTYDYHWFGKYR